MENLKKTLLTISGITAAMFISVAHAATSATDTASTTVSATVEPAAVIEGFPSQVNYGTINPFSVSGGNMLRSSQGATDIVMDENEGGNSQLELSSKSRYYIHYSSGNQAVLACTSGNCAASSVHSGAVTSQTATIPLTVYCTFCGKNSYQHIISPTYNNGTYPRIDLIPSVNSTPKACAEKPASCSFILGGAKNGVATDKNLPPAGVYTGGITVTVSVAP